MIASAAVSLAALFSVPANGGFAGAEGVQPGDRVQVSLGLLSAGVSRDVVVPIRSTLDHEWMMPTVDVSCPACIEVISAPRKLSAHEAGQIVLQVIPSSTPGPHRWGVALHGGGKSPLRVDLSGVTRGLAVSPDRAAFGICPVGMSREIVARLAWHGEGVLESVQVTSDDDTVHARVGPRVSDEAASIHITLDGGVQHVRHLVGHVRVVATIRRPNGAPHDVRAELPMSGRVVDPNIQLRPASLFLGCVGIGESVEAAVQVAAIPKGTLSLRTDMEGLRAIVSDDGGVIVVRYQAAPNARGVLRGVIRLGCGAPWVPRAEIPVTVYVNREEAR